MSSKIQKQLLAEWTLLNQSNLQTKHTHPSNKGNGLKSAKWRRIGKTTISGITYRAFDPPVCELVFPNECAVIKSDDPTNILWMSWNQAEAIGLTIDLGL